MKEVCVVGYHLETGLAADTKELWQSLLSGCETVDSSVREEFLPLKADNPTLRIGTSPSVDEFDNEFFGISEAASLSLDPQIRRALQATVHALDNAGISVPVIRELNKVVISSVWSTAYLKEQLDGTEQFSLIGNSPSHLCGRISQFLNSRGSSFSVDTACSSGLVGVHLAREAIERGEAKVALVVTSHLVGHRSTASAIKAGMISCSGYCAAFDRSGSGLVRADAFAVLVLADRELAEKSNWPIRAIISASAMNSDGAKKSSTAPCAEAQAEMFTSLLSEIDPSSIDAVFAHGTGTKVGDPAELTAIQKVFLPETPIVSCKSVTGHCETAAGIASIVVACQSLSSRIIPSQLHLNLPRKELGVNCLHYVSQESELNRIVVNAFGLGGSNAAVVLNRHIVRKEECVQSDRTWTVLFLSAKSDEALSERVRTMAVFLRESSANITDILHSANCRATFYEKRCAVFGKNRNDLIRKLESGDIVSTKDQKISLFPAPFFSPKGHRALYESSSCFRDCIDRLCGNQVIKHYKTSIRRAIFSQREESDEEILRSANLVVRIALVAMWNAFNVMTCAEDDEIHLKIAMAVIDESMHLSEALKCYEGLGQQWSPEPSSSEDLVIQLVEQTLCHAFVQGVGVKCCEHGELVEMPQYPFARTKFWSEEKPLSNPAREERPLSNDAIRKPINIEKEVKEVVAKFLPNVGDEEILPDLLDSVSCVELTMALGDPFNIHLPLSLLKKAPTTSSIVSFLENQMLTIEPSSTDQPNCHMKNENNIGIMSLDIVAPEGLSGTEEIWDRMMCGWQLHDYSIENSYRFDNGFFKIDAEETEFIDPQHRLLMESAFRCIRQAGSPSLANGDLILAIASYSEHRSNVMRVLREDKQTPDEKTWQGTNHAVFLGRLSKALGIGGSSLTVDTTCTSGHTAMEIALGRIKNKQADSALILTAQLHLSNELEESMESLASADHCRTFSTDANGFVRAEALGSILLAPVQEKGTAPLCVIDSVQTIQSGKFTMPCEETMKKLIDPSCCLIEAHGTGTKIGDWAELSALASPQTEKLAFSSKWILGHSEATSGIIQIACAISRLKSERTPSLCSLDLPNSIGRRSKNIVFPFISEEHPRQDKIGVLSYGVAGVHGFTKLTLQKIPIAEIKINPQSFLLTFSSHSKDALDQNIKQAWEMLEISSYSTYDISRQLQSLKPLKYKAALLARSNTDAALNIKERKFLKDSAISLHIPSMVDVHSLQALPLFREQYDEFCEQLEVFNHFEKSTLQSIAAMAALLTVAESIQSADEVHVVGSGVIAALLAMELAKPPKIISTVKAFQRNDWKTLKGIVSELNFSGPEFKRLRSVDGEKVNDPDVIIRVLQQRMVYNVNLGLTVGGSNSGSSLSRYEDVLRVIGIKFMKGETVSFDILGKRKSNVSLPLYLFDGRRFDKFAPERVIDISRRKWKHLRGHFFNDSVIMPATLLIIEMAKKLDTNQLSNIELLRAAKLTSKHVLNVVATSTGASIAIDQEQICSATKGHSELPQLFPVQEEINLRSSKQALYDRLKLCGYQFNEQFQSVLWLEAGKNRGKAQVAISRMLDVTLDGVLQTLLHAFFHDNPQDTSLYLPFHIGYISYLRELVHDLPLIVHYKYKVTGEVIEGRLQAKCRDRIAVVATDVIIKRFLDNDVTQAQRSRNSATSLAKSNILPMKSTANEPLEMIKEWMRETIGETEVNIDCGFFDMGLSSHQLIRLRNHLEESFPGLSPTIAFDYPNVRSLAWHLGTLECCTSLENEIKHEKSECWRDGNSQSDVSADRSKPPIFTNEPIHDDTFEDITNNHKPYSLGVIASACRQPGGASDPMEFWQVLKTGVDTSSRFPSSRIPTRDMLLKGEKYGNRLEGSHFLTVNIAEFDAAFFKISKSEADAMDPQQRLLLEVVAECLENAGIVEEEKKSLGVFIGLMESEYRSVIGEQSDILSMLGSAVSVVAGRVSHWLGAEGPSLVVDTACSSSLVALRAALDALSSGSCERAIVGAVNLILSENAMGSRANGRMLAEDGTCKAFDVRADGYGRSDGAVAILVELQREGKEYEALIPSIEVNHGGRSASLTAPNGVAQKRLLERCLGNAIVPSYWEAHGTGTSLGDPIEMNTLSKLMQDGVVSTVKASIGHGEAVSGLNGLLSIIEKMNHRYIPPLLHFHLINPECRIGGIRVPVIGEEWLEDQLASCISSFGVSGTNAACGIQKSSAMKVMTRHQKNLIIPISAKSEQSLHSMIERYRELLECCSESQSSIAATAALKREHFKYRAAILKRGAQLKVRKCTDKTSISTLSVSSLYDHDLSLLSLPAFELAYKSMENLSLSFDMQYLIATISFIRQCLPSMKFSPEDELGAIPIEVAEGKMNLTTAAAKNHKVNRFKLTMKNSLHPSMGMVMKHMESFFEFLGGQFVSGCEVNWNAIYDESMANARIPNYAFDRRIHWQGDLPGRKEHLYLGVMEVSEGVVSFTNQLTLLRHLELFTVPPEIAISFLLLRAISNLMKAPFTMNVQIDDGQKLRDGVWMEAVLDQEHATVRLHFNGIESAIASFSMAENNFNETVRNKDGLTFCPLHLPGSERTEFSVDQEGNEIVLHQTLDTDPLLSILTAIHTMIPIQKAGGSITFNEEEEGMEFPVHLHLHNEVVTVRSGMKELMILTGEQTERQQDPKPIALNSLVATTREHISEGLAGKVIEVLREVLIPEEEFDGRILDRGFVEMGMDSIAILDFVNRLNKLKLRKEILTTTDVFNHSNVTDLVKHLQLSITDPAIPDSNAQTATAHIVEPVILADSYIINYSKGNCSLWDWKLCDASFPQLASPSGQLTQIKDIAQPSLILVDLDSKTTHETWIILLDLGNQLMNKPGPFTFAVGANPSIANQVSRAFLKTLCAEMFPKIKMEWNERLYRRPITVQSDKGHGSSWLITGGLSGIGLAIAKWLVNTQSVTSVLLVSRRQPDEETKMIISQLAKRSLIKTISVDVSDREVLLARLKRISMKFTHVVHSAGVLKDGIVARQSMHTFQEVYQSKVEGLQNLESVLLHLDHPIEHIIAMSSLTSIIGNPGQANYAVANAALDHWAHQSAPYHKTSINWGNWLETGMAMKYNGTLRGIGLPGLLTDEAMRYLLHVIETRPKQLIVAKIEWEIMMRVRKDLPPDLLEVDEQLNEYGRTKEIRRDSLSLHHQDIFRDHCFHGQPIVPATFQMLVMLNSIPHSEGSAVLHNFTLCQKWPSRDYKFMLTNTDDNEVRIEVKGNRITSAMMKSESVSTKSSSFVLKTSPIQLNGYYTALEQHGLLYGPRFRILRHVRVDRMKVSSVVLPSPSKWIMADAIGQTLAAVLWSLNPNACFMPFSFEEVLIRDFSLEHPMEVSGAIKSCNDRYAYGDIAAFQNGKLVVQFKGITAAVLSSPPIDEADPDNSDQAISTNANSIEKSKPPANRESNTSMKKPHVVGYDGSFRQNAHGISHLWQELKISTSNSEFREHKSSHTALMDSDVYEFDPEFFGISPAEAKFIDPAQRLLMQSVVRSLEHAGIGSLPANTGVFIGTSSSDFAYKVMKESEMVAHYGTGTNNSVLAGRVAHWLKLEGPSLVVDSACSSSFTAFIAACDALNAGRCDFAIVGAANVIICDEPTAVLSKAGMLSPSFACKVLDSSADGYLRGEGVATLILHKDGSLGGFPIHSWASGHNGNSAGISAPNGRSQERIMRMASSESFPWREVHMTGTTLGDPVEANAVARLSNGKDTTVSSVKSALGHCEAVAGLASLIAVMEQLDKQYRIPQLHFSCPNPQVPRSICIDVVGYEGGSHEKVPINSFGFSGMNTVVVVGKEDALKEKCNQQWLYPHIIPLSVHDPHLLQQMIDEMQQFVRQSDLSLQEIAAHFQSGRVHRRFRAALVYDYRRRLIHVSKAGAQAKPLQFPAILKEEIRASFPPLKNVNDLRSLLSSLNLKGPNLPSEGGVKEDPQLSWKLHGKYIADSYSNGQNHDWATMNPYKPCRGTNTLGQLLNLRKFSPFPETQVRHQTISTGGSYGEYKIKLVERSALETSKRWKYYATLRFNGKYFEEPRRNKVVLMYPSIIENHAQLGMALVRVWMIMEEMKGSSLLVACQNDGSSHLQVSALIRSLASESRTVQYKIVGFDDLGDIEEEQNDYSFNDVVIYSDGKRHVQRLVANERSNAHVDQNRVDNVLVTGSGGIGKSLIQHLKPKKALILSRSPRSSDSETSRYARADCTKQTELQAIPKSSDISTVFHCAGSVRNGLRHSLSEEHFSEVLNPKLLGYQNLRSVLPNVAIVAMSSAAVILGSAGQANYAYANGIMADLTEVDGQKTVHWGPWGDVGMLAGEKLTGIRNQIQNGGWEMMESNRAVKHIDGVLKAKGTTSILVMDARWDVILRKQPHLSNLLEFVSPATTIAAKAQRSTRVRTKETITNYLSVEEILRDLSQISHIDPDAGFMSIGFDSFMLEEVRVRIEQTFNLELSTSELYDHATLLRLDALVKSKANTEKQTEQPNQNIVKDEIAIIGASAAFSGCKNIREFEENVFGGVDCIWRGAKKKDDREFVVRAGGIIDDIDKFDNDFFHVAKGEADRMDPQIRCFVQHAYKALESSGYIREKSSLRIGVWTAAEPSEYSTGDKEPPGSLSKLYYMNQKDFVATWTAHLLDLRGPAIAVYTACSSALIAVQQASMALKEGTVDMAIVGAVSLLSKEGAVYEARPGGVLSPDASCRPFEQSANGIVRGSGVGCLVLKRLSKAMHDGDVIQAVIKAIGTSNDGVAKASFMAPNTEGMKSCMKDALNKLSLKTIQSVKYIECHGTGTRVGDEMELTAINEVYENQVEIGSVKANIGHAFAAAGMAGILKAIAILRRQKIPPQINFEKFHNRYGSPLNLRISTDSHPIHDDDFALAVSAFGIGGTNAHMILGSPPPRSDGNDSSPPKVVHILPISAATEGTVLKMCRSLADYLEEPESSSLERVASTLQHRRSHFKHRVAISARSKQEAVLKLRNVNESIEVREEFGNDSIAFYFAPQGVQYPRMEQISFNSAPVFQNKIRQLSDMVSQRTGIDFVNAMYPKEEQETTCIMESKYAQVAIFIISEAITAQLLHWGIESETLIGHSVGEYAAFSYSHASSAKSIIELLLKRGELISRTGTAKMLAVKGKLPKLPESAEISAYLANNFHVVVGKSASIDKFEIQLVRDRITFKELETHHGFHSSMMDPIQDELKTFLCGFTWNKPRKRILSNIDGEQLKRIDSDYCANHLRRPIRIDKCISNLKSQNNIKVIVQIGPTGILESLFTGSSIKVVNTCLSKKDAIRLPHKSQLIDCLATLWEIGYKLDFKRVNTSNDNDSNLPAYKFESTSCWNNMSRPRPQPSGCDPEIQRQAPNVANESERSQEDEIRSIWKSTLELHELKDDANFFEIGGNSMSALNICWAVNSELGIEVPVNVLFDNPVFQDFVKAMEKNEAGSIDIVLTDKLNPLPLTHAQYNMFILHQLDTSNLYNVVFSIEMEGRLDVDSMRDAILALMGRQHSLRSVFAQEGDHDPTQTVLSLTESFYNLDFIEYSAIEWEEIIENEMKANFQLSEVPVRITAARLNSKFVYCFSQHHIVTDGWSVTLVAREISNHYKHITQGLPRPTKLMHSIADIASWEMSSMKMASEGAKELSEILIDKKATQISSKIYHVISTEHKTAFRTRRLMSSTSEIANALAAKHCTTPFVVYLAGFLKILRLFSDDVENDEMVIGCPVSGRTRMEMQELIGYFLNNTIVHVNVKHSSTLEQLIPSVRDFMNNNRRFESVPYHLLVAELSESRSSKEELRFNVYFNFRHDLDFPTVEIDGLKSEVVQHSMNRVFETSVTVDETPEGMRLMVEYHTEKFGERQMKRLLEDYANVLEGQERDKRSILTGPKKDFPQCGIMQIVQAQSTWTPDAAILKTSHNTISYSGLLSQVASAAFDLCQTWLTREGVYLRPDDVIPIESCSNEIFTPMLAVLWSGSAYAPIDPQWPEQRKSDVLRSLGSECSLNGDNCFNGKGGEKFKFRNRTSNVDAVYVIHTSGSTGTPKGVVVSHRNLVSFITSSTQSTLAQPEDVFPHSCNVLFDVSLMNMFTALCNGATLFLPSNLLDVAMEASNADCNKLFITSALFNSLPPDHLTSLKQINKLFVGGESIHETNLRRCLQEGLLVTQIYGPTEATVWSLTDRSKSIDGSGTRIGLPIENVACWLWPLERRIEEGHVGELILQGPNVARGYLHDHSTDKFMRGDGEMFYRTGDLVKMDRGAIQFLGRTDKQVKISGHRVDVVEIENAIVRNCSGITDVSIQKIEEKLVAFVVVEPKYSINSNDILEHVRLLLPAYMVPSRIVCIQDMPLTRSGKVDSKKLIDMHSRSGHNEVSKMEPGSLEERLARIWSTLLKVNEIHLDSDFFCLGAHSLLLFRLRREIELEFGCSLDLSSLFMNSLFSHMIQKIRLFVNPEKVPSSDISAQILDERVITEIRKTDQGVIDVYTIHGVGGTIFNFFAFENIFPSVFNLFGIEYHSDYPATTLTELATFYAEHVSSNSKSPRIALMGHSMGGLIAREMAPILGLNSAIMLDTWLFDTGTLNLDIVERFLKETFSKMPSCVEYVSRGMKLAAILQNYTATITETKIILIKAEKMGESAVRKSIRADLDEEMVRAKTFNGLERTSTQPVDVYLVNGDHDSMLSHNNLTQCADTYLSPFKPLLQ